MTFGDRPLNVDSSPPLNVNPGYSIPLDECLLDRIGKHSRAGNCTNVAFDPRNGLNPDALPSQRPSPSFSRGISPRMSSRISMASRHPGPEHSTSTWRRSSLASGHRIRWATRPPSTRKTICPRNARRRAGLTPPGPIAPQGRPFRENVRMRRAPPANRRRTPSSERRRS
jgi:hypothetical protein